MKKNILEFSANGTEFTIKFKDGSESLTISSKQEGYIALTDLVKKEKITPSEFAGMMNQILGNKEIPWGGNNIKESILIGSFISNPLESLIEVLALGSSLSSILAFPDKPVKTAFLKMSLTANSKKLRAKLKVLN